ncbi:MAG: glycosyltransferase [Burkholderiales bacterium]|nr:glycosyltransferase [Phycisphaerae bacterium]
MKRILLITSVLPWPLRRNGGAQRSALLKKALEHWGHVDVFAVGGRELQEGDPGFTDKLIAANVTQCLVRRPRPLKPPFYMLGPLGNLWRTVRGYESNYQTDPEVAILLDHAIAAHQYDLIVSRYLQPALQSGIDRHPAIPALLDFDDIDWATFDIDQAAKPWPGLGGKVGARLVRDAIKTRCDRAMPRFRKIFVTSQEDRALLDTSVPSSRPATTKSTKSAVDVLPNIPFSERDDVGLDPVAPARESRELLFVGDLQFPPNRDGLDRFLNRIWPTIRIAIPDASVSVVGRGLTDDRAANWRGIGGVNVIGFAPDLVDCYRRCAFTVVPIYFGGGTKIKVLESLAYGRTVVTTPSAMRGYAQLAEQMPAVAVASDDDEFAAACIRLLQSPDLRDAMAERGRMIVAREFSFSGFRQVVDRALHEVFGQ